MSVPIYHQTNRKGTGFPTWDHMWFRRENPLSSLSPISHLYAILSIIDVRLMTGVSEILINFRTFGKRKTSEQFEGWSLFDNAFDGAISVQAKWFFEYLRTKRIVENLPGYRKNPNPGTFRQLISYNRENLKMQDSSSFQAWSSRQ